ncbi:MAG: hypothetical protein ABL891_08525 [Burkholderiales bacterium]
MDALGGINLAALAAGMFNAPRDPSGAADRTPDREHGARTGDIERGHRHGHVHHGHRSREAGEHADAAPVAQPALPAATESTAESATALTYRRTEKTALYIQTQEGDTVRLKIKSREAVDAASATAQSGDTVVSELQLAARSSTKIAISVEGDLNPDELAAIQSVVEQAGELADAFFAGNLPSAFSDAAALQIDASQLSQVGLRLSMREQTTYAHLGAQRALPAPAPVPAPASAPVAAPAAAVTTATAPDGAAPATAAEPVATAPATTPAAPAGDTASPVAADNAPPLPAAAGVRQTITGFLHQLLDTLGAAAQPQNGADSSASIHMALKIKIFQSVLMTASSSAIAPAGAGTAAATNPSALPALVPETLDALAAQQQSPLSVAA